MSLPEDDDAPTLFGDGDDDASEATVAVADHEDRDTRREITEVIHGLADGEVLDFAHLAEEVRTRYGYVAEGVIRKHITEALTAGAIEVTAAGDPLRDHYRRPKGSVDLGQQRAVCLELAGWQRDSHDGLSAFEIAEAMSKRSGGVVTVDDVEPILDGLIHRKMATAEQVKRAIPSDDPFADDGPVTVTVYKLVDGLQYNLLAPGLNALLGATATVEATGNDTADRAAIAAGFAGQITDAQRQAAEAIAQRDTALQRAVDAERRADKSAKALDAIRDRLEGRGLHDVYEEIASPVAPKADEIDLRGKPMPYEKRMPITEALEARFAREGRKIRGEVKRLTVGTEQAKKNYETIKASGAEKIALLQQQLDDMDAAAADGSYLLIVPAAYKVFDHVTRRTAVHDYGTREFVCWDDPYDLPAGAQPALPGVDVPAAGTKPTAKGRSARKAKPKPVDAADTHTGHVEPTAPPWSPSNGPVEPEPGDPAEEGPDSTPDPDEIPDDAPDSDASDSADDTSPASTPAPVVTKAPVSDPVIAEEADHAGKQIDRVLDVLGKHGIVEDIAFARTLLVNAPNRSGFNAPAGQGLRSRDSAVRDATLDGICGWIAASLTGSKRADFIDEHGLRAEPTTPVVTPPVKPVVHPVAEEAAQPAPVASAAHPPLKVAVMKLVLREMVEASGGGLLYADTHGVMLESFVADFIAKANYPASLADRSEFRPILRAAALAQVKNRVLDEAIGPNGATLTLHVDEPKAEDKAAKGRKKAV